MCVCVCLCVYFSKNAFEAWKTCFSATTLWPNSKSEFKMESHYQSPLSTSPHPYSLFLYFLFCTLLLPLSIIDKISGRRLFFWELHHLFRPEIPNSGGLLYMLLVLNCKTKSQKNNFKKRNVFLFLVMHKFWRALTSTILSVYLCTHICFSSRY